MPGNSNARPVVMVSSTSIDLPEHRKEVMGYDTLAALLIGEGNPCAEEE